MTLSELATRLGCRLEGDGAIDVRRVAALAEAGPHDLSFLSNPKYAAQLGTTRASAVIAADGVSAPCAILRSTNPYLAMAEAIAILSPQPPAVVGVSAAAVIDASAEVGADAAVGAFAWIGPRATVGPRTIIYPHAVIAADVVIGADCVIHAHVSIRERVRIGDRVHVQDAAVIGSDGFGFARRADGSHQKIPQIGGVVIENDVEIGAHTAIDRPAVGETRIAAGTKIDNLVQVGHGVKIGRNALLAAQVGIAGSATIGDAVTFAGQSGAVGHVHIGDGVVLTARSAATNDIEAGRTVSGFPAIDLAEWRRSIVLFHRLPELRKQLDALETRLASLEQKKP